MKRIKQVYADSGLICKLDHSKYCYTGNPSHTNCDTCSKNPYRYDNRQITPGQIKFLTSCGLDPVIVSKMNFLQAGAEIRKIKKV